MEKTKEKPVKDTPLKKNSTEKPYDASSIKAALIEIDNGSTVYKAAKKFSIPWSTLKAYCLRHNHDRSAVTQLKRGKPFVLPPEIEVSLLSYINRIQEFGSGLSFKHVCAEAYRLAEEANIKHPFSKTKKRASWVWWDLFKKRYNVYLEEPESWSMNRAQSATSETVNEFYKMLKDLYTKLGVSNQPNRIWNLDEIVFQFIVKSGKIVALTGKTHVYKQTLGEEGSITTVLPCVNVAGDAIPPMIIFEDKRWDDRLKSSNYPCLIKVSEKSRINRDLVLEFFEHFVENIPLARPVVLLMDSHKSLLAPEVIDLASKDQIYIVTYPPHLTHLLQPLNVGIFGPLEAQWKTYLNKFQTEKPREKPTRHDFLGMFEKAYKETMDKRSLIMKAFEKAGIFPINYEAVTDHVLAPSSVTCDSIGSIAVLQIQTDNENMQPLSESEQSLAPDEPQPGCSGTTVAQLQPIVNSNICGTCKGDYEQDVKLENGAEWIECQFCKTWNHMKCQNVTNPAFFLCSNCELSD